MARLAVRGPFEPGRPLVCRKPTQHGGRRYRPGDPFPGRTTVAITSRRVKQLFEGGWLMYGDQDAPVAEPEVETPAVEPEVEAPVEETPAEEEAPAEDAPAEETAEEEVEG